WVGWTAHGTVTLGLLVKEIASNRCDRVGHIQMRKYSCSRVVTLRCCGVVWSKQKLFAERRTSKRPFEIRQDKAGVVSITRCPRFAALPSPVRQFDKHEMVVAMQPCGLCPARHHTNDDPQYYRCLKSSVVQLSNMAHCIPIFLQH